MATSAFSDRSGPGGIVHNPASAYAKEMAKWEMGYSPYGPPGRPREQVGHQEYPAMYYKMSRSKTNGDFVCEHYISAENPTEAMNLMSRGYRLGRAAAEAYVVEQEQARAVGAAERAASDRRMSEKAKAEAAAFEATTVEHVTEIPAQPVKRRGRPKKTAEPT
jgi:hypothetical protein